MSHAITSGDDASSACVDGLAIDAADTRADEVNRSGGGR
jgi:hypothetical protein